MLLKRINAFDSKFSTFSDAYVNQPSSCFLVEEVNVSSLKAEFFALVVNDWFVKCFQDSYPYVLLTPLRT